MVDAGDKNLHFALFTQREERDAFWGPTEEFAKASQQQLNVKISVYYARRSKQRMLDNLKIAKADGVDAVIFPNLTSVAYDLIRRAELLKLPVLLFNADIADKYRRLAGYPREKYSFWLASLMPDEQEAGYILGKALINRARELGLQDSSGFVNLVALNGIMKDSLGSLRFNGLEQAVAEDSKVNLLASVQADWEQDTARRHAGYLTKMYPNIHVFWAASDLMAIGVSEGMRQSGLVQGKDYWTGGIDWSSSGLKAVKEKQIHISVGGHFMLRGLLSCYTIIFTVNLWMIKTAIVMFLK